MILLSDLLLLYSLGWDLEAGQREFAEMLVDRAGVDVVWGHSSHHVKASGLCIYSQRHQAFMQLMDTEEFD